MARFRLVLTLAILLGSVSAAAEPSNNLEHAATQYDEAQELARQGDFVGALEIQREVLTVREWALGQDHIDTVASHNEVGSMLLGRGEWERARPHLERAVAFFRSQDADEELASGLHNLSKCLVELRLLDESEAAEIEVLELWEATLGPDHPNIAAALTRLVEIKSARGDFLSGIPMLERGLEIRRAALGPDDPGVATSANNLAVALKRVGRIEDAAALMEEAVGIWENHFGPEHPWVAIGLSNLADIHEDLGDYESSLALLDRALAISETVYGAGQIEQGTVLSGANEVRGARDRYDGILTAEEVSSLDLHGTALVVLSACETGLGEAHSGEGVLGLRRAFSSAGARNVVMSLWAIPDQSTAVLMDDFYAGYLKKRRPQSPAAALRGAQLSHIERNRDAGGHASPGEWGAFIVTGR